MCYKIDTGYPSKMKGKSAPTLLYSILSLLVFLPYFLCLASSILSLHAFLLYFLCLPFFYISTCFPSIFSPLAFFSYYISHFYTLGGCIGKVVASYAEAEAAPIYARGVQGVLPMRVGDATSQLDLPSLTALSVVGCG